MLLIHSVQILFAFIIDAIIGDPKRLPHPVIWIGNAISRLENRIRKRTPDQYFKIAGLLFPLIIVGGTFLTVWLFLYLLSYVHPLVALIVEVWIISTTVAAKGLMDAGKEVYHHLKSGDIDKARTSLSMVVGRDTKNLGESEISRGAVETVAENIVDAIISPLFFALIGGAPLAMAYRAVNTLDSMVGYKNEKYKELGWASARLDDLCNYIPARITACFLIFSSIFLKLKAKAAYQMVRRDARLHPSPNSGFSEAAVAGALGIQLGGTNYYEGIPSHRAKMGDVTRMIHKDDILKTITLMWVSSAFFVISALIFSYFY